MPRTHASRISDLISAESGNICGMPRSPVLLALLLFAIARPAAAAVHQKTFPIRNVPGVDEIRYGISVPDDYKPGQPRPLVLALHPGGERPAFYGSLYLIRFFMA